MNAIKNKINLFIPLVLIAAVCGLFFSTTTFADVIPSDESQEPVSPKQGELPESSPSSPPLATDDPGTPGPNGVEVNFIGGFDFFKSGRISSGGIDANYGIGDRIQLRIEKDALHEYEEGDENFNGLSSTDFGIKWRFYDDKSLKAALYPSYNFDDGTRHPDLDDEGRSAYLPIILSKSFGAYTVVANAGVTKNFDYLNRNAGFLSLAVGRALSDTFRIMTEIASEKGPEGRRSDIRFGVVKEIFPDEKSKYETGMFGSIGESIGKTEDGQAHTTLLVGFSIARKPD